MSAVMAAGGPGYRPNGGAAGDPGPPTDRTGPRLDRFSPGQSLKTGGTWGGKWNTYEVIVRLALDVLSHDKG